MRGALYRSGAAACNPMARGNYSRGSRQDGSGLTAAPAAPTLGR